MKLTNYKQYHFRVSFKKITLNMIFNDKAFTLVEIIAVLAIISILAAVSVPRFIDLSSNASNQAIVTAVTELNGRESLLWVKIKLSESGWLSDEELFPSFDASVGSDYKWNPNANINGGSLQFKDNIVSLQRLPSTTTSPGNWQIIKESDGNKNGDKDKDKDKDKNKDKGNNGKKNDN
jgi:prepilin-type N-terminal cleavage/methylation domain-containing protein